MLPHHNHPVAIWQRDIENDTEGRQSVNHFAQNCQLHNCNERICAIKSMAPLQHDDTANTVSILQYNGIV